MGGGIKSYQKNMMRKNIIVKSYNIHHYDKNLKGVLGELEMKLYRLYPNYRFFFINEYACHAVTKCI